MIGGLNPNLPFRYGASYKSRVLLASNVASAVFSAAANANGAIIWDVSINMFSSSGGANFALIAKATAPSSVEDGDVLLSMSNGSSQYMPPTKLLRPVFVPAGLGLWCINNTAEATPTFRHILYTLL